MTSAHLQSRLLEDQGLLSFSGTSFGEMGGRVSAFSCANSDAAITIALSRFETCLREDSSKNACQMRVIVPYSPPYPLHS